MATNPVNYNSLFKQVFGEYENAVPETAILTKDMKFQASQRLGLSYLFPVQLADEQGCTFSNDSSPTNTLNPASAGTQQQASLNGSTIYLRGQINYQTLNAAAQQGKQAFAAALSTLYQSMQRGLTRKLEATTLYGGNGLGVVSSVSGQVITLTSASWGAGLWIGSQGTALDIYTSGGTQHASNVTITAVNVPNMQITVSGSISSVVANDVIYFYGAKGVEQTGLASILSNTGTLFGINAGTYDLWAGQQYNVNGPISLSKLLDGVSMAANAGLDGDAVLYVNNKRFNDLNSNEAALRRYGAEKNKTNGAEAITYFAPSGSIEIRPHRMVWNSHAFLVGKDNGIRIGSTDMTFRRPGLGNADQPIYFDVMDAPVAELRAMVSSQVLLKKPAQSVLFTGITD